MLLAVTPHTAAVAVAAVITVVALAVPAAPVAVVRARFTPSTSSAPNWQL
jgi:hypothetical protein